MTWRATSARPHSAQSKIVRHVIHTQLNSHFLSYMVSCSTTWHHLAGCTAHVIDTHLNPRFLSQTRLTWQCLSGFTAHVMVSSHRHCATCGEMRHPSSRIIENKHSNRDRSTTYLRVNARTDARSRSRLNFSQVLVLNESKHSKRVQSMPHLESECSYRRAQYDEAIQRR